MNVLSSLTFLNTVRLGGYGVSKRITFEMAAVVEKVVGD